MVDPSAELDSATQGLLDALEDPSALIDDEGVIQAVNPAWMRPITGLSAPGIGRGPGEALELERESASPTRGADLAGLIRSVATGRRDEEVTDIAIGPHSARVWFEMRLRRLPASQLILLTYRDISRRVHAEEQLRLSRSRLRSVIAGAPIVLLGLDSEGVFRVVEGVGASGLGATPELLIGRSVFEVYAHLPPLLDAVRGALAGETLAVAVPVGRLTYELRFSPTIDRVGRVRSVVGVATDITERTRIEEMKNEFVSVVSHELRTPLTSIRGSLGLLEGGVGGELSDDGHELVRIARSNSERLIRLINDILDLDKLEAGRLEFRNEPLVPHKLVAQAVEGVASTAADAGIEIIAQLAERPAEARGDADRLVQVLINLLSNAVKFAPAGSSVVVSVENTSEGALRFEVRDEGPGIEPTQKKRLFRKFQQLESHNTRQRGGSGLGLAICKAIVDAHRGQIGVDSQPGNGSVFYFELAPANSRAGRRPPASGRGISGRTVEIDLAHVPDSKTRGISEDLGELGASLMRGFEQRDVEALRALELESRRLQDAPEASENPALHAALGRLAEGLSSVDESLDRPTLEQAFAAVMRASRA